MNLVAFRRDELELFAVRHPHHRPADPDEGEGASSSVYPVQWGELTDRHTFFGWFGLLIREVFILMQYSLGGEYEDRRFFRPKTGWNQNAICVC